MEKIIGYEELNKIFGARIKMLHDFLTKHNIKYYAIAGTCLGAIREHKCISWDDDADFAMFREDYEKFLSVANQLDERYLFLKHYQAKHKSDTVSAKVCFTGVTFAPPTCDDEYNRHVGIDIFPLDFLPNNIGIRQKFCKKIRKKVAILKHLYAKSSVSGKKIKNIELKIFQILLFFVNKERYCNRLENLIKKYEQNKELCSYVWIANGAHPPNEETHNISVFGEPTLVPFYDYKIFVPNDYHSFLKDMYGDDFVTPKIRDKNTLNFKFLLGDDFVDD